MCSNEKISEMFTSKEVITATQKALAELRAQSGRFSA